MLWRHKPSSLTSHMDTPGCFWMQANHEVLQLRFTAHNVYGHSIHIFHAHIADAGGGGIRKKLLQGKPPVTAVEPAECVCACASV